MTWHFLFCVVLWPLIALPACEAAGFPDEIAAASPWAVVQQAQTGQHDDEHDHRTLTSSDKPETSGPITVQAALSHKFYSESLPEHLILKVDLTGSATEPLTRPPLNLALVFDGSGSMAEDHKFPHAMQAARLVIENLSKRDVISVIVFGDRATVLSPAGPAVNKEFLYYRLGQFVPEGHTNLSAGLLEAFAQIDSRNEEGQLKRVIALTDGLANRGVTDSGKLRNLVAAAHRRGIGVSTLGCGSEFDENLLTDLAGAGGGRFTYVRSSDLLPNAIAAELNGLLNVVAQNVNIEVRAGAGGQITRVYSQLIDRPISSHSFNLGDIRDGDRSVFLVELRPSEFREGATSRVDVILTFDNPETGAREQRTLHSQAIFTKDTAAVQSSEDEGVMIHRSILDAMETAEEALKGLDIERFQQAKGLFDRVYVEARQYAIEERDQQLLNYAFLLRHFMAELETASRSGLMHDHSEARTRITKKVDYRRYLMGHHQSQPGASRPDHQ